MQQQERHRAIIRAVENGAQTISQLTELTGASAITIRRDLITLEDIGGVERFRGGARPAPRRGAKFPLAVRLKSDPAGKRAIAAEAASMVSEGMSVLFDAGTTPLAVAKLLAGRDISALAMSLYAGAALAKDTNMEVVIPGGSINSDDLAVWGAAAVETVLSIRFDLAFIGAGGLDPEAGIMSPNLSEATLKRAYFEVARRVIAVATPDKFGRLSTHKAARIDQIDTIITNELPADVIDAYTEAGANLVMVSKNE